MKQLFKYIYHLGFYVVIFFGAVWLLLGISPVDAYGKMCDHLGKMFGHASHFAGNMGKTMGEMNQEANNQLQSASDRFHGKDPYAKLAEQLDASVSAVH